MRIHPVFVQQAVIIDCLRTAVGKAPRKGTLRSTRPGRPRRPPCIRASAAKNILTPVPNPDDIEDLILGCAMPEGRVKGMNMARNAALSSRRPSGDFRDRRHDQSLLQFLGTPVHCDGCRSYPYWRCPHYPGRRRRNFDEPAAARRPQVRAQSQAGR